MRQHKLPRGFEKDPVKLRENSAALLEWAEETGRLAEELCEGRGQRKDG